MNCLQNLKKRWSRRVNLLSHTHTQTFTHARIHTYIHPFSFSLIHTIDLSLLSNSLFPIYCFYPFSLSRGRSERKDGAAVNIWKRAHAACEHESDNPSGNWGSERRISPGSWTDRSPAVRELAYTRYVLHNATCISESHLSYLSAKQTVHHRHLPTPKLFHDQMKTSNSLRRLRSYPQSSPHVDFTLMICAVRRRRWRCESTGESF